MSSGKLGHGVPTNLVSGTARVLLLLKTACVVVRCCVLVVGPDGFIRSVPAMLCYPVGEFNSFVLT